MSSTPHSATGSGAFDLEAAVAPWHEGLKLRSRASCSDLQLMTAGCSRSSSADERDLVEKAKPALTASALAGRLAPLARRSWRRLLSATLGLVLFLVLVFKHRQLYRHGQDAAAHVYYDYDPVMLGRAEQRFPAPHCCRDAACGARGGGRAAVVTYLRDDSYAPLLRQLDCTLRRSNPGLELALMFVQGELSEDTLGLARSLNLTLLPVQPLDYPNTYEPKYGRNWLKVRALGLTQYDSVLLVDADVAILDSVAPLFTLPVEFAAVWDQSKWLNRYHTQLERINGGVFLLRPCAAVEAHMVGLLEQNPKLRFVHGTAEQSFFGWYYRYEGATLPLQWNCQAEECLVGDVTVGGAPPKIVHYTKSKPFSGPVPGAVGQEYLCTLEELDRRAAAAAPGVQAAATQTAAAVAAEGGLEEEEAWGEEGGPEAAAAAAPARRDQQEQQQQQLDAEQAQQQHARQAAAEEAPGPGAQQGGEQPVGSSGPSQQAAPQWSELLMHSGKRLP